METWYEASAHTWATVKVRAVDVEKSAANTLVINGRRRNKLSTFHCYFATPAEAWDYLEQQWQKRIDAANKELQYSRSELGKLKSERKAAGI